MKKVSAVNRSNSAKISHNGNGTTANSNRFLPNSLKFIASCIKTVSSNVKSAGASVAGSISGDSSDDLLKDQVYKTIFFPFEIYWVSEFIFFSFDYSCLWVNLFLFYLPGLYMQGSLNLVTSWFLFLEGNTLFSNDRS